MNNIKNNMISPQAADILIARRDGDMTLLYLWLCRTGSTDRERAGQDLFMPRQRLDEAFERLEMCGLVKSASAPARAETSVSVPGPEPEDADLPDSYTIQDVRNRMDRDEAFSALIDEAKLIVGRPLSSPDLVKILGIYDHFDLPAEVIMLLMHYVADCYREKYGESRRPSVRAFEREARIWIEKEVTDFDAAERHIREQKSRRGLEAAVRDALQIVGRDFTDTEKRYVTVWLDWGLSPEMIAYSYDKTVTNTRKFSLAYMNRILENWHQKGYKSLKEIQEKDRPASRAGSGQTAQPSADPNKIRTVIDQI